MDTLTWITGRHQFKFGFDIRPMLSVADFREYGISCNFGSITRAIDQQTATLSVQALAPQSGMRFPTYSFFAQDTWRVTSKLSLNYGLRWKIVPPPSGSSDRPIYGADPYNIGITSVFRPDRVEGVALYQDDPNVPGGRRFNTAAFRNPTTTRQGTLGRNVLRSFSR